jgi:hypothetical protein
MTARAATLLLLVACLAAVGVVATPAARSADPTCTVGGPPSLEEGPNLPGKPSSPEVVVACGKSLVGPFQIVVYTDDQHSLCTIVLGEAFGGGDCGGTIHEGRLAHDGFLVTGGNWTWGRGPGRAFTALSGRVLPDVARVEVRYHRQGRKALSRANATVGQVDGELLGTLGQTEPFGRFAVVLPGCTIPQDLRILAFDAEGQMIGSERGRGSAFGNPCRPQ